MTTWASKVFLHLFRCHKTLHHLHVLPCTCTRKDSAHQMQLELQKAAEGCYMRHCSHGCLCAEQRLSLWMRYPEISKLHRLLAATYERDLGWPAGYVPENQNQWCRVDQTATDTHTNSTHTIAVSICPLPKRPKYIQIFPRSSKRQNLTQHAGVWHPVDIIGLTGKLQAVASLFGFDCNEVGFWDTLSQKIFSERCQELF